MLIRSCPECGHDVPHDTHSGIRGWLPCIECYLSKHNPPALSKSEDRRLQHLIRQHYYIPKLQASEMVEFGKTTRSWSFKDKDKEKLEAHLLFDKMELPEPFRASYWLLAFKEKQELSKQYSAKPIAVKKDNPNTYGEKFVGGGTPRVPRKVRKTAWKRFTKLFPNLNK